MAFPVVQSVTRANNNTNATNRNVTLPATINANDILIALFVNDGDATVTWDNSTAGTWTSLFSTASGSAVRLTAFYKIADGTEDGKVLDIATSAIERSAWHIYRISGAQSVEAGTATTGTGTAPDPDSLSPSWGSEDTTWLPVIATDNQTADTGSFAYPTNYPTNGIYDEAANAAGCGVASSYRDNAASSENVGAWTLNASLAWVANTIAVRPAAGATNATASPGIDTLVLTGFAPTVSATQSQTASPGIDTLVLTGFAPTVSVGTSVTASPGIDTLVLTGQAPTVSATSNATASPGSGAVVITGYPPSVTVPTSVTASPGVGALVITGYPPTVSTAALEDVQTRSQGSVDPHYYKKRKKKKPEPVSKDFGDDWKPPTPRPAIPPLPPAQEIIARQDAAIARTQAQLARALEQLARQQAEAEQEDEDEAIMLLLAA